MKGDSSMKESIVLIQLTIFTVVIIFSGCTTNPRNTDGDSIPDGSYVSISGDKEFTSIQEAIDQAPSNYTVYVFSGLYNETITINKTITLMGQDPETTIIDGFNRGNVITINDAEKCNITGFTIQNGKSGGSGIEVKTSYNSIKNNIIKNNYNGIYCTGGVTYNSFIENTFIQNNNYAIYIYNSNYNTVNKSVFMNNSYGMRIKGSRYNNIIENHFQDNDHGMYYCCGATSNLAYHNIFINNDVWNANDYVGGNTWYNQEILEGNYWDDYTGLDENNDGIGDRYYNVTSDGSRQDKYPLMNPWS